MNYQGIVISGPKYVGKTSISKGLILNSSSFTQVKSITTRVARESDNNDYEYISKDDFINLRSSNNLILEVEYNNEYYGIRKDALPSSLIPIFVIAPESIEYLEKYFKDTEKKKLLTFFIDADDTDLNLRYKNREGESSNDIDIETKILIQNDRKLKNKAIFYLKNKVLKDTISLIEMLWMFRESGGILHKDLLQCGIKSDLFLQNAKPEYTSAAAYDLHLGDEYYYAGEVKHITEKNPFFIIEPYDYAIVTSREFANLPRNVAARFSLTVGLFTQGIILSNGTQIDPGFRGKLFCLLFNTSNKPVVLKQGQKYATMEFNKLIMHTEAYEGKYQDQNLIIQYLPPNVMQGAVSDLKKELDELKNDTKSLHSYFMGVIALILATIPLMLLFRG